MMDEMATPMLQSPVEERSASRCPAIKQLSNMIGRAYSLLVRPFLDSRGLRCVFLENEDFLVMERGLN